MKNNFRKAGTGIIAALLVLAVACSDQGRPQEEQDPAAAENYPALEAGSITFEQQTFSRASPSCVSDSSHCATMDAVYPLAVSGPERAVKNINDSIEYAVKRTLAVFAIEKEEIALPLEQIAQNYLGEYQGLINESLEYGLPWTVETNGKVLYHSDRIASIQIENYSFTGGAHPNSIILLQSFDLRTGKKMTLEEMVRDRSRLEELVEKKFREVRELNAGSDLADAGFFWGEAFALPANYALTQNGLYCYYNPYEVAAYALGPTEFTLTYEELGDLLHDFQ